MTTDYKVAGGIITSPGKFQGEPAWVPYLYEQDADQEFCGPDDERYWAYKITKLDREYHPALLYVFAVVLCESDDGFVHSKKFATGYELGVFINEMRLAAETDENG